MQALRKRGGRPHPKHRRADHDERTEQHYVAIIRVHDKGAENDDKGQKAEKEGGGRSRLVRADPRVIVKVPISPIACRSQESCDSAYRSHCRDNGKRPPYPDQRISDVYEKPGEHDSRNAKANGEEHSSYATKAMGAQHTEN